MLLISHWSIPWEGGGGAREKKKCLQLFTQSLTHSQVESFHSFIHWFIHLFNMDISKFTSLVSLVVLFSLGKLINNTIAITIVDESYDSLTRFATLSLSPFTYQTLFYSYHVSHMCTGGTTKSIQSDTTWPWMVKFNDFTWYFNSIKCTQIYYICTRTND